MLNGITLRRLAAALPSEELVYHSAAAAPEDECALLLNLCLFYPFLVLGCHTSKFGNTAVDHTICSELFGRGVVSSPRGNGEAR